MGRTYILNDDYVLILSYIINDKNKLEIHYFDNLKEISEKITKSKILYFNSDVKYIVIGTDDDGHLCDILDDEIFLEVK